MESSYRDYSYYNTIMAYYYANKNTNTINYLQNIHNHFYPFQIHQLNHQIYIYQVYR